MGDFGESRCDVESCPAAESKSARSAYVPEVPAIPPGRPIHAHIHTVDLGEIVFGPYRLLPQARKLHRGDTMVRIGSRAMDLLILLATRAGSTLTSEELMAAVWPGIYVERNTLRVQIAALRKLLGAEPSCLDCIVTVTGRGYAFAVPPVSTAPLRPLSAAPEEHDLSPPQPALSLARLIGRDSLVAEVGRQLGTHRLVTLVGPGGAGKTAVAMQVAALAAGRGEEVVPVDLSPLPDGELLAAAVAGRLGLPGNSLDPTATILRYLSGRRTFLLLDTCEHLIAAAARFVEAVLAVAPAVRILATSREALRVAEEQIHPVHGLPSPVTGQVAPAEALTYPAVRLFVERAGAASAGLRFAAAEAPILADICRRLDGLPLAIELAAALVPHFGVTGLLQALSDRFALLTSGYRTALPRHQTLRATVEWSYRLLDEAERRVFRRFSVLRGAVAWDDAVAVLAFDTADVAPVKGVFQRLTAKSLIEVTPDGLGVRCRMLDTNRDFAWAELVANGEQDAAMARHVEHWTMRLENWTPEPADSASQRTGWEAMLANVRSALRWCWSTEERRLLGVRLTLAAVPLWTNLSLIAETIEAVGHALEVIPPGDPVQRRDVMRLHAALGGALMNIDGAGERVQATWSTVLTIAEELDDREAQLKALWGLWIDRRNQGDARGALTIAQTYARLSSGVEDPLFAILGDRMLGVSHFFVGRFTTARDGIERMLARSGTIPRSAQIAAFQFDQSVAARCFEAQILWLQGFPEQARAVSRRNVEDAVSSDHAGSISYALSEAACPIALRNGNLEELDCFAGLLMARTKGAGLAIWHTLGRCYESFLLIGHGRRDTGLRQLAEVLGELRHIRHGPLLTHMLGEYAAILIDAGRATEAERALREAFGRLRRNGEGWCAADLKRVRGELAARNGNPVEARRWFERALAESRRQGALAWELRAATSFARLLRNQGDTLGATTTLSDVLGRYGEGWGTQDLLRARSLYDEVTVCSSIAAIRSG
ncbi:ATP-binding protein [Azospirillum brasilense]|uniref:OmpR/PhoB-type domain-containing protein n=1 Tax=Azospirillum brasilense TaxID=192 RepID=A0A235HGV3_AZOBR|nr:winged helix-turn-helix domain-containing protein [Azospirillum brasilense]OYD84787.1 hypothetical protein CHT98_07725 [Azospirillum brasilense]